MTSCSPTHPSSGTSWSSDGSQVRAPPQAGASHRFPLCLLCFPLLPSNAPSFSQPPDGPGRSLSGCTWFWSSPGPCQLLLPTPLWLHLSSAASPSVLAPEGSAANRNPQGSPSSPEQQLPCLVGTCHPLGSSPCLVSFNPPACPGSCYCGPHDTREGGGSQTPVICLRSCS